MNQPTRRQFIRRSFALAGLSWTSGCGAWPPLWQRPAPAPRVGYLGLASSGDGYEAFRTGLRELGYVDGQSITIEERWAGSNAQLPALYHRAAAYVDKIIKGAQPADLPVEQPTTFDFVINLKAAQSLGVTIPPSVLAQATEII